MNNISDGALKPASKESFTRGLFSNMTLKEPLGSFSKALNERLLGKAILSENYSLNFIQ